LIKQFKYLTVLVFFCSGFSRAEIIERIVAVINNEIILESDFVRLKQKMENSTLIDDSMIIDSNLEAMKNSRKVQLAYLTNERVLDSEVKRLNLSVTMERVDQEIKDMAKRNNISSQDLLKTVAQEGISASEYQSFLKTKIERQSLIENEIISKLRITDEEALVEYLRRNKDAKVSVNEFSLAHIFFNPKKSGHEAALKRAQVVLDKIKEGVSFESLAEQNSEDPNFSAGGLLGTFKTGEFLREIEESIARLEPNQLTGIVKSRMGFHIVKLLTKKVTVDSKFEKEKESIKSQLMENNFKRQLKIWLASKREDSQIRINSSVE
jgi:peptidyl-prolyl cis-trans isomerase SurA